MKAVQVRRFGEPEVMELVDLPEPEAGPGEIIVRVRAAGVNPVDTYIRSGHYPRRPDLPYIPGFDAAGEIAAVGPGIQRWRPGQRVYVHGGGSGTYAEYVRCTPVQVHPLPDHVSFAAGAALGVPYATAYRALFQIARARPGEWVLVHGAIGGVGTAAVQLATAQGMRVIGTAGTPEGLQRVRTLGAIHALNHHDTEAYAAIPEWTHGEGVDVILEMRADLNLDRDLKLLARFGRIVVIGNRGRIEIDPRDAMARDAAVLGMSLFNTPAAAMASIHAALAAGLEKGFIRPVIGREYPLAEAPAAHRRILEPGAHGKIVLIP